MSDDLLVMKLQTSVVVGPSLVFPIFQFASYKPRKMLPRSMTSPRRHELILLNETLPIHRTVGHGFTDLVIKASHLSMYLSIDILTKNGGPRKQPSR